MPLKWSDDHHCELPFGKSAADTIAFRQLVKHTHTQFSLFTSFRLIYRMFVMVHLNYYAHWGATNTTVQHFKCLLYLFVTYVSIGRLWFQVLIKRATLYATHRNRSLFEININHLTIVTQFYAYFRRFAIIFVIAFATNQLINFVFWGGQHFFLSNICRRKWDMRLLCGVFNNPVFIWNTLDPVVFIIAFYFGKGVRTHTICVLFNRMIWFA